MYYLTDIRCTPVVVYESVSVQCVQQKKKELVAKGWKKDTLQIRTKKGFEKVKILIKK